MTPKNLRYTLQTEALDKGWYGYHLQRYVGHAPSIIGEKHYPRNEWNRMVSWFRDKVVSKIDDAIQEWKYQTNSYLFMILDGKVIEPLHDYCTVW